MHVNLSRSTTIYVWLITSRRITIYVTLYGWLITCNNCVRRSITLYVWPLTCTYLCKKKRWFPDPTVFYWRGNKRCHLLCAQERKKKKKNFQTHIQRWKHVCLFHHSILLKSHDSVLPSESKWWKVQLHNRIVTQNCSALSATWFVWSVYCFFFYTITILSYSTCHRFSLQNVQSGATGHPCLMDRDIGKYLDKKKKVSQLKEFDNS